MNQIYLQKRQHAQAVAEAERALALDPNWADGYVYQAITLRFSGRAEEAVELAKKAMRLNPRYPAFYQYALGFSYCQVGRYEDALTAQQEALSRNPNSLFVHVCLAACYSMAGRDEEARTQVQEILRISPNFSLEATGVAPYKDPADGKAMLDALRKAGLKSVHHEKHAEGSKGGWTKAKCCPPFRVLRPNESLHPDRGPTAVWSNHVKFRLGRGG